MITFITKISINDIYSTRNCHGNQITDIVTKRMCLIQTCCFNLNGFIFNVSSNTPLESEQ